MEPTPDQMRRELAKPRHTKASEALGKHEGKTLMVTQADRTKVGGGYLGGPGFSSLQHTDPAYEGKAWGVMTPGMASTILGANKRVPEGQAVWSTLIGTPEQHTSNQMVFDKLVKDFNKNAKLGALTPELHAKINERLSAIADKQGKPFFGPGADIRDPELIKAANTFAKRKIIADLIGGHGVGGKKGQIGKYDELLHSTTEPDLLGVPTHAIGPRLFGLSGETSNRPDLHPAFPQMLHGEDFGQRFHPAPKELMLRDYMKKFIEEKQRKPGYMDLTLGYSPTQHLSEDFLTHLQKHGYAEGGAVKADEPSHDEMLAHVMLHGMSSLKDVGANEAPNMPIKTYVPQGPGPGFPVGGVDFQPEVKGQQMLPGQPGQPLGQPGQPPQGAPAPGGAPGQPPAPAPGGPQSNILQMTPQGQAMAAMKASPPMAKMAGGGSTTPSVEEMRRAIASAATSAGMKAPVTNTRNMMTLQDSHQSLQDRIREGAADMQNMIESMPFKYDVGHDVFTAHSAKNNLPPFKVIRKALVGNSPMREDSKIGPGMGKPIKDPMTGKTKRTPYEPGYDVRREHKGEVHEMRIPESAILDKLAAGGIVEMKAALLHKADGGGVTGSGSLDLHIPLNAGGGGGGGSGGNSSVGLSSTPTGGGSAPTAGGSGQGLGGLLDSGRSFLGNTMTSHLMQNQSYDINKPAQGSNMPYIPAPQPSSPIAPPVAGSTPSSPIAAPMPTTPAPGNPNLDPNFLAGFLARQQALVNTTPASLPPEPGDTMHGPGSWYGRMYGGNTSGTPTPAPDTPPPQPALGQLGNPNNPEIDPGYRAPMPYVPAPGNPNNPEIDPGYRAPMPYVPAPGNPNADTGDRVPGNRIEAPMPIASNGGLMAGLMSLIGGNTSDTPSRYAKGGSIQAMKQELASKKAAGGPVHMAGGGDPQYPSLQEMIQHLQQAGRTSIVPAPNRWFADPVKHPHQQKMIERVLAQTGQGREGFPSGSYINPQTGEPMDFDIMHDLGVAIDPKTGRPMMSGIKSDLTEVDPKYGSITKSNLVRKGLFKHEGGDELLKNLAFLATIEKSGKGHHYGLSTQYASPAELVNTMTGQNPTLRPHSRGDIFGMGDEVGRISIQGKHHPVYEKLLVAPTGSDVPGRKLHKAAGGTIKDYIKITERPL